MSQLTAVRRMRGRIQRSRGPPEIELARCGGFEMRYLPRPEYSPASPWNGVPMRTVIAAVVLLGLASPPLGHAHSPPDEKLPQGVRLVTGAELPTYHVWRAALHALGGGEPDQPTVDRTLPVSAKYRELILKHARQNVAAETANRELQRKKLETMVASGAKQGGRAVRQALTDIDYEHRVQTMLARSAILAELPEEERFAFEKWVESWRDGIKVTLLARDLDLFMMQP
jgi:hypothetical protein